MFPRDWFHRIAGVLLVVAAWPGGVPAQTPVAERQPADRELAALLTQIRPTADETAYRTIGWRNEFWPAVQEAQRLGRPILFWTMNGHPLGCT